MEVGDPWQLLTISNNKLTHRQPHHAGRRWGAPAMLTYNLIYWGHLWVHDFGCLLILPKSHSISLQSWLKFHPLETQGHLQHLKEKDSELTFRNVPRDAS